MAIRAKCPFVVHRYFVSAYARERATRERARNADHEPNGSRRKPFADDHETAGNRAVKSFGEDSFPSLATVSEDSSKNPKKVLDGG